MRSRTANQILNEMSSSKLESGDDPYEALQRAAKGDYDEEALYVVNGRKVRIVSSGIRAGSLHLVLVTDPNSRPLGVPFLVQGGESGLAGRTLDALVKAGG